VLINPSLPLAGNILSRVVLYIWYICIVRQTARAVSQPFQTQPVLEMQFFARGLTGIVWEREIGTLASSLAMGLR
jgi:hypothetical protein